MDRFFVYGLPGPVGGANTELYHTLCMWWAGGWRPTILRPEPRQSTAMLDRHGGADVVDVPRGSCLDVPGMRGSTVVSFCHAAFLQAFDALRDLQCRLVWVPCMTAVTPLERKTFRRYGPPDVVVFQSDFQRSRLEPQLAKWGYTPHQGRVIRGAFAFRDPWYRRDAVVPRVGASAARVSRIARPDPAKWPRNYYSVLERIADRHAALCRGEPSHPPFAAELLGVDRRIDRLLGRQPACVTARPPGSIDPGEVLGRSAVLLQLDGQAAENWPRVGLEAMAAGAVVVASQRGGWGELIRDGQTGFLAANDSEAVQVVTRLLRDDELRYRVACHGHAWLRAETDPAVLRPQWDEVLS